MAQDAWNLLLILIAMIMLLLRSKPYAWVIFMGSLMLLRTLDIAYEEAMLNDF